MHPHRKPPLDELAADGFGHWLAGFLDGEAAFVINKRKRDGYHSYVPTMKVALRSDDRPILEEASRRLGVGSVFDLAFRNTNQHPQVAWSVHRRSDCLALVEVLDRFPLRAKKHRDYQVWREAVVLWTSRSLYVGGRRGPQDWREMEQLYHQLQDTRRWTATSQPSKSKDCASSSVPFEVLSLL